MRKQGWVLLALLAAAVALFVWAEEEELPDSSLGLAISSLPYDSPAERRLSMSRLRHAWFDRPSGDTEEDRRAELSFINRFSSFARHLKETETRDEAARFWMHVVKQHREKFLTGRH